MTKEFKLYRKKLHFKFKAGTSRGYYTTRDCYFLTIEKNGIITAIGECSPLPGLSAEYTDKQSFESKLEAFVARANYDKNFSLSTLKHESSILFAFESVLLHEDRKSLLLFNNGFTQGKVPIKINGLIWMGDYETMRQRIISKVNSGFKCIKVKIGAIDFIKELELLKLIRSEFSDKDLTLRVDANGAFFPENALNKLEALAKYDIHSIEQPIKAGQYESLSQICKNSPIPIALDEELIGVNDRAEKEFLLEHINPDFIVLKPTLHGGLKSTIEWIKLAQNHNIGYWITSALESSIGLNVLAQLTGSLNLKGYQGLGTGQLFTDNLDFKALCLNGENLSFNGTALNKVDIEGFLS